MRGIETPVQEIRRKIFAAISKVAFESTNDTFNDEIEAIPYTMVGEVPKHRESVYRERAIVSERVRLAMGMSLRPENRAVIIMTIIYPLETALKAFIPIKRPATELSTMLYTCWRALPASSGAEKRSRAFIAPP